MVTSPPVWARCPEVGSSPPHGQRPSLSTCPGDTVCGLPPVAQCGYSPGTVGAQVARGCSHLAPSRHRHPPARRGCLENGRQQHTPPAPEPSCYPRGPTGVCHTRRLRSGGQRYTLSWSACDGTSRKSSTERQGSRRRPACPPKLVSGHGRDFEEPSLADAAGKLHDVNAVCCGPTKSRAGRGGASSGQTPHSRFHRGSKLHPFLPEGPAAHVHVG